VAHVINLLNPPRLIISGDGLRAGALLQEPLLRAVDAATLHLLRATTEIVFHPWTDEMLARGAASIVLRQIDEAPWSAPVT
jgi:predicted NBD/HSP70 family sugar kinase